MHSVPWLLRRSLAPLALLTVEAGAVAVLHRLGSLPPFRLPSSILSAWSQWLTQGHPADVVASIVRVVGLAGAWWLLISTVVYALAAAQAPAFRRAVARFTPRFVRRCCDGMVALTLAGVLAGGRTGVALADSHDPAAPPAGGGAPATTAPAVPAAESAVVLPADIGRGILFPRGTGSAAGADPDHSSVVTGGALAPVAVLPDARSQAIPPSPSPAAVLPPKGTTGQQAQEPPGASGGPGVPPPAGDVRAEPVDCAAGTRSAVPGQGRSRGGPIPADSQRTVRPGESLWTIAAREVAEAKRAEAGRVASFWLRLVDANRGTLASRNPDRIRPGELVLLPPLDEPAP